jgi:hypothetical protein
VTRTQKTKDFFGFFSRNFGKNIGLLTGPEPAGIPVNKSTLTRTNLPRHPATKNRLLAVRVSWVFPEEFEQNRPSPPHY